MEPEFVLGTTYTLSLAFFESVVLPHLKRRHLKRCLILCDQVGLEMAMSEAPALRYATRDYMVATAPTKSTFHAKVWLLLARNELVLLAGSGNLTQPGFIENVELFDVVRVAAGGPGRELASDTLTFLRGLGSLWHGISDPNLLAVQTLREMTNVLADLAPRLSSNDDASVRLLSSFAGPFPSQFASLGADTTYIASPYFGNSVAGLEKLHSDLGSKQTFVFPAWHKDGKLDLPIAEAAGIPGVRVQSLSLSKNRKGFAHLKLYGFRLPSGQAWTFTGSVNCTMAALTGPNVEAGLLRRVAAEDLNQYFEGVDLDHGESSSHFGTRKARPGWLILWATDVGDQITVELAPIHMQHAPLTEVNIELRTGQRTASVNLTQVFGRGATEHLPWRGFGNFRNNLHSTAALRLTAIDAHGQTVSGECLVDDFATLTSDPVHRSAWRAAVALLGAEGMPEYGDIAALFSLADIVAEAHDDSVSELEDPSRPAKRVAGSTTETIRDKAAVWPPTPLLEDAVPTGHFGRGAGNIYWFNRILAAFLRRTASEPETASAGTEAAAVADEGGPSDPEQTGGAVEADAEDEDEMRVAARRLWQQTSAAMDRMRERLRRLEITESNAHRIWGPATFVFLGVSHVARTIRCRDVLRDAIPSSTSLVRTWLGTMFAERDQGENYASMADAVYEERVFPSVASDLWTRLGEAPHPEVLSILCIAFAHIFASSHADKRSSLPVAQWLMLRDAAGDLLAEAVQDKGHLEHLWESYFRDDGEGVAWAAVSQALHSLEQMTWMDHQGMKDLVILRRIVTDKQIDNAARLSEGLCHRLPVFRRGGFRTEEVSHLSESCGNTRCPQYGIATAQIQGLLDLRPVICSSCGCLLIPDVLNQAFRRLNDARAS